MKKIINWFNKQIRIREADDKKGYLNEYGKGYLDGLKEALSQVKNLSLGNVSDTLLIDDPINFMCWLRNWGHLEESKTIKEDFEELILQYKSVSNVDHSNDR